MRKVQPHGKSGLETVGRAVGCGARNYYLLTRFWDRAPTLGCGSDPGTMVALQSECGQAPIRHVSSETLAATRRILASDALEFAGKKSRLATNWVKQSF